MSQITLRGNKGSALSYGELDENFATIGLTDGMDTTAGNVAISVDTITAGTGNITTINSTMITTTDIDVSNLIINTTGVDVNEGSDPRLQIETTAFNGVRFRRIGQTGAYARSAGLFQTEYTDQGYTVGQGSGYWTQIITTDGKAHAGAVLSLFETVTDAANWKTRLEFRPVKTNNSTTDYDTPVLTASHDKVEIFNTDVFNVNTPLKLHNIDSTGIGQLSASSGTILYNTTSNAFEGWNGTSWVDLGGAGGGGTAYDQSLNTTDDVTFNSIQTNSFTTTGTGTSEIESATTLTLTSSDGVIVSGGPLRLPSFTTTERDALTAVDGDVILNTTDNAIQARVNGNWVNL